MRAGWGLGEGVGAGHVACWAGPGSRQAVGPHLHRLRDELSVRCANECALPPCLPAQDCAGDDAHAVCVAGGPGEAASC